MVKFHSSEVLVLAACLNEFKKKLIKKAGLNLNNIKDIQDKLAELFVICIAVEERGN